ncbi:MAG: chloride channel protein [Bacteroidetes bacterium]|nr:chloride channel protein [Bacteroidota bacterium]
MVYFRKVISKVQAYFTTVDNEAFKKNLLNALPFWVGAILTGLVSVLYAKLFAWAEAGTLYLFNLNNWLFFFITPLCFVFAWWLVKTYAPMSRGSGIPQVSASIELANPKNGYKINKLLGLRVILVKIISSLVMVFGGGVIGREGPTIQIGASIFKKINDLLPEWYPKISKQNMIITGAAAGLASAFNTPLGGIVFAIEELTKTHFSLFKSALLTGVIIAGLTALMLLGPYLYLGYPPLKDLDYWLILGVIPVAIVTGVAGGGMGRIILLILKGKKAIARHSHVIIYTIISGILLASIAYFIDFRAVGSGKEFMVEILFAENKEVDWFLPVFRILGQIISFTVGAAGGIFAPSLSAGADLGAVFAGWFDLIGSEANLIILCGMVGFLTGITRSPFTSSILVIEMTTNHTIIFHLMLTALVANLVSNWVSRQSFYDHLKNLYIIELQENEEKIKPVRI